MHSTASVSSDYSGGVSLSSTPTNFGQNQAATVVANPLSAEPLENAEEDDNKKTTTQSTKTNKTTMMKTISNMVQLKVDSSMKSRKDVKNGDGDNKAETEKNSVSSEQLWQKMKGAVGGSKPERGLLGGSKSEHNPNDDKDVDEEDSGNDVDKSTNKNKNNKNWRAGISKSSHEPRQLNRSGAVLSPGTSKRHLKSMATSFQMLFTTADEKKEDKVGLKPEVYDECESVCSSSDSSGESVSFHVDEIFKWEDGASKASTKEDEDAHSDPEINGKRNQNSAADDRLCYSYSSKLYEGNLAMRGSARRQGNRSARLSSKMKTDLLDSLPNLSDHSNTLLPPAIVSDDFASKHKSTSGGRRRRPMNREETNLSNSLPSGMDIGDAAEEEEGCAPPPTFHRAQSQGNAQPKKQQGNLSKSEPNLFHLEETTTAEQEAQPMEDSRSKSVEDVIVATRTTTKSSPRRTSSRRSRISSSQAEQRAKSYQDIVSSETSEQDPASSVKSRGNSEGEGISRSMSKRGHRPGAPRQSNTGIDRYREKGVSRGDQGGRDKTKDREWDRNRDKDREGGRNGGKNRDRNKDKEKDRRKDKEHDRGKDREGDRTKNREGDRTKSRDIDRVKDRENDRIKGKEKDRNRDRDRDRDRDRGKDRNRDKDRNMDKDRDTTKEDKQRHSVKEKDKGMDGDDRAEVEARDIGAGNENVNKKDNDKQLNAEKKTDAENGKDIEKKESRSRNMKEEKDRVRDRDRSRGASPRKSSASSNRISSPRRVASSRKVTGEMSTSRSNRTSEMSTSRNNRTIEISTSRSNRMSSQRKLSVQNLLVDGEAKEISIAADPAGSCSRNSNLRISRHDSQHGSSGPRRQGDQLKNSPSHGKKSSTPRRAYSASRVQRSRRSSSQTPQPSRLKRGVSMHGPPPGKSNFSAEIGNSSLPDLGVSDYSDKKDGDFSVTVRTCPSSTEVSPSSNHDDYLTLPSEIKGPVNLQLVPL